MACCSYSSAEFVGNSLIFTDISGNTTDINLILGEARVIGNGFKVHSATSGSQFIPDDNELLGPGTPLTYEMVRDAIDAADPDSNPTYGGGPIDATTTRVAIATDSPGIASLTTIASNTPTLDNGKQPVIPSMTTSGHLSAQTNATGTNWTAFASQACKQLTVSNQTGTTLEFRQGGAGVGFRVPAEAFYTFFGISNANSLEVRRVDTSNTQVTVTARWEN